MIANTICCNELVVFSLCSSHFLHPFYPKLKAFDFGFKFIFHILFPMISEYIWCREHWIVRFHSQSHFRRIDSLTVLSLKFLMIKMRIWVVYSLRFFSIANMECLCVYKSSLKECKEQGLCIKGRLVQILKLRDFRIAT